jgi:hypothetical protein
MRKRLDAIETRFNPVQSGVVFFPLQGETDEEMDKRIAKWYAGEKVEGQDKVYTGGMVGRIKIVRGKP